MGIDYWNLIINGFAAFGTLALALVALKTIRQNVQERRNRLLEDIVEWAKEVGNINVDFTSDNIHKLKTDDGNLYISLCVDKALRIAEEVRLKTPHTIGTIKWFGTSGQKSVTEIIDGLESLIKALKAWNNELLSVLRETDSDESALEGLAIETGTQLYLLSQYVGKFIAESNKVKIKNIG